MHPSFKNDSNKIICKKVHLGSNELIRHAIVSLIVISAVLLILYSCLTIYRCMFGSHLTNTHYSEKVQLSECRFCLCIIQRIDNCCLILCNCLIILKKHFMCLREYLIYWSTINQTSKRNKKIYLLVTKVLFHNINRSCKYVVQESSSISSSLGHESG